MHTFPNQGIFFLVYLIIYMYYQPYLFAVIEAGIISQAKGSAYMELENTKVICAM